MKPKWKGGWTPVPNQVIRTHDLKPADKAVFNTLLSLPLRKDSGVLASHSYLAVGAGCSRPTVIRALNSLRDKGMLSWKRGNSHGRANIYFIKSQEAWSIIETTPWSLVTKIDHQSITDEQEPVKQGDTINTINTPTNTRSEVLEEGNEDEGLALLLTSIDSALKLPQFFAPVEQAVWDFAADGGQELHVTPILAHVKAKFHGLGGTEVYERLAKVIEQAFADGLAQGARRETAQEQVARLVASGSLKVESTTEGEERRRRRVEKLAANPLLLQALGSPERVRQALAG